MEPTEAGRGHQSACGQRNEPHPHFECGVQRNVLGVNATLPVGRHGMIWDGRKIYFFHLGTTTVIQTRKEIPGFLCTSLPNPLPWERSVRIIRNVSNPAWDRRRRAAPMKLLLFSIALSCTVVSVAWSESQPQFLTQWASLRHAGSTLSWDSRFCCAP